MATPHNPLTLKSEQKQKILHTIIDKQTDKEKYLQSMYLQEIQALKNKKQMLQSLLESRQSLVRNGSRLEDSWKYHQDERYKSKINGSLLAESNLDQSHYQPNSPKKLHSLHKKISNQSPIRKLNNSSKIITKNSHIDLMPSSPTHYNKIEQLQNELSLIQSRLSQHPQSQHRISSSSSIKLNEKQKQKPKQKQKQKQKQKEDEISANLWQKIKQQEDVKLKEFQRQRLLQIKKMYAKQIKSKIDKVKEEIFKNSKTLNIVQRDLINRNKDIIKGGYTRKMLQIIQSYAGSRKA